jgi:predicted heme/steroid binding protein
MDSRTHSPDRAFTRSELASYNGRDGRPVYVAFGGRVYDVTSSPLWSEGEHQFAHAAGDDLTDDMGFAPHGEEVLARFQVVGTLRD